MAGVSGLFASIAMVLDGFMQPVIGSRDAAMTLFISIRPQYWSGAQHKTNRYCGDECRPFEKMVQSRYEVHESLQLKQRIAGNIRQS
jgi:hypothetical protein